MRQCLIVLGMHRSGTSALTGVLNILGVDLGSNLMNPTEENPKGFFENYNIFLLNEKILKSLNSSWDDLFLLRENWWNQERLNIYKKEIIEVFKKEFYQENIISIKDPRLCILLPFWKIIFSELNIKPHYIICIRNPLEVAESLKKRNGFSLEKSMLLWQVHMLDAEFHSRHSPRVFVSFNELLKEPGKIINSISKILGVNFPKAYPDVKDNIEQFLEPSLKHHSFEKDTINKDILDFISDYYHILLNLTCCIEGIGDYELSKIDAVRGKFWGLYRFFYNEDIKYIKNLEATIREKDASIGNLEATIREKDASIGNLEATTIRGKDTSIRNLEATIREKDATLNNIYNSHGWKALLSYYGVRDKIFPANSKRRILAKTVFKTILEPRKVFGNTANLGMTLQEREPTLGRIYSSRGWKCPLFYYRVRDGLLPHNSKRRAFVKAIIKAVANPLKLLKNLNVMNIRKFFHYLKNADPSVLEYKINTKLSANSGSDFDSSVPLCAASRVNMPVEKNSVLLMGSFESASEGDYISKRVKDFIKSLKELHYDITLLDRNNNVEEYLRTYGGRFSFVIGIGPEYCYNYFPLVRAYAPNSMLIYHIVDLQDDTFTTELFNASIADSIIVDAEDKRQKLLQRNTALKIEITSDTTDVKNDIERVLSNLRQREQREVCHKEKTLVAGQQKELAHDEENKVDKAEDLGKKPVLIVGIYLANQENTIEHIIDKMNRSKKYHVVQKWIALLGDAPSENVKAVTNMKFDNALPKFQLLNKILSGEKLDEYAYVVISDDDIKLPDNFLDSFISLQEKYDFAVAQPARTHNSYIDHYLVERMDGLKARRTRFVEIGPLVCFRRDMLSLILPFDESTPMGWGFDFVLPCVAEKYGLHIGIIDATPVEHNIRKPMRNYRYDEAKEAMEQYLSKNSHLSREKAFTILESYT